MVDLFLSTDTHILQICSGHWAGEISLHWMRTFSACQFTQSCLSEMDISHLIASHSHSSRRSLISPLTKSVKKTSIRRTKETPWREIQKKLTVSSIVISWKGKKPKRTPTALRLCIFFFFLNFKNISATHDFLSIHFTRNSPNGYRRRGRGEKKKKWVFKKLLKVDVMTAWHFLLAQMCELAFGWWKVCANLVYEKNEDFHFHTNDQASCCCPITIYTIY